VFVEKCCNQILTLIITIVSMVRDSISRHDAGHTLCHIQTSDQYQTRFPSRQISGVNLTLRSLYIYSIHIHHITRTSVNARASLAVNIRRVPSSVLTSSQRTSSKFSNTKCAPHSSIFPRAWLVHTATTMAPAATPALIPLGESSKTTQREAR